MPAAQRRTCDWQRARLKSWQLTDGGPPRTGVLISPTPATSSPGAALTSAAPTAVCFFWQAGSIWPVSATAATTAVFFSSRAYKNGTNPGCGPGKKGWGHTYDICFPGCEPSFYASVVKGPFAVSKLPDRVEKWEIHEGHMHQLVKDDRTSGW